MSEANDKPHTLVLYDGLCGLCNRFVVFLLRHDQRDEFRFAPLASELVPSLLRRHGLDLRQLDTVAAVPDFGQPSERALVRSSAVLWALGRLGGVWKLAVIAMCVPRPLRDALYDFVARHRYRIFGKFSECALPSAQDRHKFLSL
jgi:predicted DCC family thiol-disulfide oxidoreductase YuxK